MITLNLRFIPTKRFPLKKREKYPLITPWNLLSSNFPASITNVSIFLTIAGGGNWLIVVAAGKPIVIYVFIAIPFLKPLKTHERSNTLLATHWILKYLPILLGVLLTRKKPQKIMLFNDGALIRCNFAKEIKNCNPQARKSCT